MAPRQKKPPKPSMEHVIKVYCDFLCRMGVPINENATLNLTINVCRDGADEYDNYHEIATGFEDFGCPLV